MIEIQNLTAGYAGQMVLAGVNLTIMPGHCTGLLGPSGSGKSTLLRCLTGELRPATGSVRVGGWTPGSALPPPGTLGMVWQDPVASLDFYWSIEDCVAEPLRAARDSEAITKARAALVQVKLGHIDPRTRVSKLSIGQAQRVSLARAIVSRPHAIIADEPTSALDPTSAAAIVRALHAAAAGGAAVLVVSHNENLLSTFCNKIVTLATISGRNSTAAGRAAPTHLQS
ncbi:ATP-binding cassette domain-containing protein [Aestuariivirga sp.]|uniref:ATP-binding cassette domain-containing protein n=1 Tax=Aestuariivirga sp. TaxID=2650926 RepID=UPI003BAD8FB3